MIVKSAKACLLWFFGTLMFYIILVIYGAPLTSVIKETFQLSCILSTLTVLPCCIILGLDSSNWIRVFAEQSAETSLEVFVQTTTLGTLVGVWLGAFPIPLDWDRPWQEWPFSCVIGAVGGFLSGLLIGLFRIGYTARTKQKSKFV